MHAFLPLAVNRLRISLSRLSVLVECCFFGSTLLLCAACREETSVKHAETENAPDDVADETQDLYLATFIPDLGIPVVLYRHPWMHVEGREMNHEPGEPFDAESTKPYALEFAAWEDGTIIWSQGLPPWRPQHYEGKLDRKAVQQLLAAIDTKRYRTPEHVRYSEESLYDRYSPTSMIAILDDTNSFVLCSNLDQMELLKEYWYWDGSEEMKYPFDEYSFEQFCDEVPESYSRHLQDYADLRHQLRSVIPKEGKNIDLHKRIRWVVLPIPGGWH